MHSLYPHRKVGSRGNLPGRVQDRHLRDLSDVLLRNSFKHAASVTRIFRFVPELRAAKILPAC
jgi:hypothetical protein